MRISCIVISGRSGTGKSALSAQIAELCGYRSVNVGDLLARRLGPAGATLNGRRTIGRTFLSSYSVQAYCRILAETVDQPTILDGVRLPAGIRSLRSVCSVLHVHREDPVGMAHRWAEDDFASELAWMKTKADLLIPWHDDREFPIGRIGADPAWRALESIVRWLWRRDAMVRTEI